MTPGLTSLQPYPFERLTQLKQGVTPPTGKAHIAMSIGEPAHATPHFIQEALLTHLHGLGMYPNTKGLPELRAEIGNWISRRFKIPGGYINPETQILPVSGTREALFSFAQCLIDPAERPVVVMPNPFYQIYEGAALLAGAEPYFLNTLEKTGYLPDFDAVPEKVWQRCRLIYICSPGNPSGSVMSQASHEQLIHLAEKYDFVIASDECYSELYDDENNPPPGLLETAYRIGNSAFKRCVVFHSLSKRSNAPGLRSGFVAGDADILQQYFKYRTYQGCAMPLPTQHASIQAWQDEVHVIENRRLYREKFAAFIDILADSCMIAKPPAGFYIWLKIPQPSASLLTKEEMSCLDHNPKIDSKPSASPFDKGGLRGISDTDFAKQLFARENITVLPGSFLSREFDSINPGLNHVRIALVAPLADCIDAAQRIKHFLNNLIVK